MFTSSGRHIQIAGRRYCPTCQTITDQVCHKVRYQDNNPSQEGTLLKKSYWICSVCVTEFEEVKVQPLPGESEDYQQAAKDARRLRNSIDEDRIEVGEANCRDKGWGIGRLIVTSEF